MKGPKPGGTAARGYGGRHQRSRREWAPRVEAGQVICWDCGRLIVPGSEWHMGHLPWDRSLPPLPQHALCNLSMAGRKAGRMKRAQSLRRRPRPFGPLPGSQFR